ncbi:MAG TPA: flagellar biosynthetic protein FliO [Sphingomicrobium sp.]|nr:flagellar biosynthetic protein FliO [Sphingomicrobium sp.]
MRLAMIGLIGSALAGAAEAQRLGGAADADISLVRVFLALLFCLLIAGLAVFFLRQRYGGRSPSFLVRMKSSPSRIRVVESRRIGPQSDVTIVECDDREFLLLLSPGGPALLRERPLEPAPEGSG